MSPARRRRIRASQSRRSGYNFSFGPDPHISPAAAEFQIPRVAKARGMSEEALLNTGRQNTQGRQWGFFGEPRVNVLELNLALDSVSK